MTLRGMFKFAARTPVPIDEVEPVSAIVARFKHRGDELRLHQPGSARDDRGGL